MIVSKSIKDYCDAILNNNLNFDLNSIDFDTISNEVCKFIKFDYRLFRKKKIIKFLTKLTEIGLITNISLEFKKGDFKAYMRDDFKLYLNSKYVRKSSRSNLIITLIHEVSHLYIASRDNYEALLDLDKTFFKKYDKNDETILISPVEYYADFIMNKIFFEVCLKLEGKIKRNLSKTLKVKSNYISEIINKYIGV